MPSESEEWSDTADEGAGDPGDSLPEATSNGVETQSADHEEAEGPAESGEEESDGEEPGEDEGEEPQLSPEDEAALAAIEAELTEMLDSESTGDPYEELESARAELKAAKDQQLRLAADFDNYRRRVS